MIRENQMVLDHLRKGMFPPDHKLDQICWTYEKCSEDDKNRRYLVASQVKAIKFEKLTEWICQTGRQSVDSMTFTDRNIVLIEFKAGDRTRHGKTKKKLIEDVIGKINDSETTVFRDIISGIENLDESVIRIGFYLVVDAEEMGIDSRTAVLLKLAQGSSLLPNDKIEYLMNRLLPDLKKSADHPEHFSEIDIWYANIFNTYLDEYGIKDIMELH